jgi:hypothetical protein
MPLVSNSAILSLTSPGIQPITDMTLAVQVAQETNDLVRQRDVDPHPGRFSFFACLPTQGGEEAVRQ